MHVKQRRQLAKYGCSNRSRRSAAVAREIFNFRWYRHLLLGTGPPRTLPSPQVSPCAGLRTASTAAPEGLPTRGSALTLTVMASEPRTALASGPACGRPVAQGRWRTARGSSLHGGNGRGNSSEFDGNKTAAEECGRLSVLLLAEASRPEPLHGYLSGPAIVDGGGGLLLTRLGHAVVEDAVPIQPSLT